MLSRVFLHDRSVAEQPLQHNATVTGELLKVAEKNILQEPWWWALSMTPWLWDEIWQSMRPFKGRQKCPTSCWPWWSCLTPVSRMKLGCCFARPVAMCFFNGSCKLPVDILKTISAKHKNIDHVFLESSNSAVGTAFHPCSSRIPQLAQGPKKSGSFEQIAKASVS